MKIIFESQEYYEAIYEVQSKIRDTLKYKKLSDDECKTYEYISDLICDKMNERKLKHYWTE